MAKEVSLRRHSHVGWIRMFRLRSCSAQPYNVILVVNQLARSSTQEATSALWRHSHVRWIRMFRLSCSAQPYDVILVVNQLACSSTQEATSELCYLGDSNTLIAKAAFVGILGCVIGSLLPQIVA
jgi:hypothetical protein